MEKSKKFIENVTEREWMNVNDLVSYVQPNVDSSYIKTKK